MKIQKYFGFISYNGKYFYGSQFQTTSQQTVQGKLKDCLAEKFPKNLTDFSLRMASRTDAGVHAVKNVFDFFLKFEPETLYPASVIKNAMNSVFLKRNKSKEKDYNSQSLFVTDVFLCENDFDSRKDSMSRKYIYKIRYSPNLKENNFFLFTNEFYYNIFQQRGGNSHSNLKIDKIADIIQLFEGQSYNYTNFYRTKNDLHVNPFRKIDRIECIVKEGAPSCNGEDIYEICLTFEARSFLRNQIRYIMNTILDYACDKISKDEISDCLLMKKVNDKKVAAPAEGLYLMDVKYDESKYHYHEANNRQLEEIYRQSRIYK